MKCAVFAQQRHWHFPCLPTISNSWPEQSHYPFTFLSSHSRFLNHCFVYKSRAFRYAFYMQNTRPRGICYFKKWSSQAEFRFTLEARHLEKSDVTRLRHSAASISYPVSWPEAKYLLQEFTELFNLHRETGNLISSFYITLCFRMLSQ